VSEISLNITKREREENLEALRSDVTTFGNTGFLVSATLSDSSNGEFASSENSGASETTIESSSTSWSFDSAVLGSCC